jgi:hypothetical protein
MDCRYFDGCSAPLWPKDEGVADRTWFADGGICRLADVPDWVKRQRKVSRKAAPGGYFTRAMPEQDCRICAGMKGIDPDGTEKERERNRASGLKNKGFLGGAGCKKDPPEPGPDALPEEKGS